jgi:hypothetical protein
MSEFDEINNRITLNVVKRADSYYIEIPQDMAREMGFNSSPEMLNIVGVNREDDVNMKYREKRSLEQEQEHEHKPLDGGLDIRTQWVLVETVILTKRRYVIETPLGESQFARDDVVMEECTILDESELEEVIISDRIVTCKEAVKLFRDKNPEYMYLSDACVMQNKFTFLEDWEKP